MTIEKTIEELLRNGSVNAEDLVKMVNTSNEKIKKEKVAAEIQSRAIEDAKEDLLDAMFEYMKACGLTDEELVDFDKYFEKEINSATKTIVAAINSFHNHDSMPEKTLNDLDKLIDYLVYRIK